uniref:Si:ch211-269k10.4 n=1 Tax=Astyanax mexicanus TaxID=7994 RepID=A0A3B1K9B0_ASTMX
MARASIAMNIIEENPHHPTTDNQPLIKYYKATTLIPDKPPALHRLLDKQPAAWAQSVQITSGILSFGLGVVFAVAFGMEELLLTLFRVPILTGIMFLVAGFLSNLLYKHPGLLQICFHSNILCLVVAAVGVVLLCVDLEVVVLCVTVLDMLVSIILIIFIRMEK